MTNQHKRSYSANTAFIGTAVALFLATSCGTVAMAAAASRSVRGVVPESRETHQRGRRREHSSTERALPATDESPAGTPDDSAGDQCSDLNRKRCKKHPGCEPVGGECLPKGAAVSVADEPILLDWSDTCTHITSRKKCKRDKACRYNRKVDYCHRRQPKKGDVGGGVDPKADPQVIDDPSEAEIPLVEPAPIQLDAVCGSMETCYEAGSTCAVGTETCCGVTHNSMECTCFASDDGRLQYACRYSDACMFPSCCWDGPPLDQPPPADGTCSVGKPCDTGIEDDYCCFDEMGGKGTFCTKSGGAVADDELVDIKPMLKMYQGQCTDDSQCEGGLVCHITSGECVCNALTNEGCGVRGQVCGVPPGLYCPGSCRPTCTCDDGSDAVDGSNGCPSGQVCRTPCAMADGGPMCFESNERRDCGEVWGSNYICRDSNEDGVIDRHDYAAGCVEGKG